MASQLGSGLTSRQNITNNSYPFMNYDYQMGHNPSQMSQSQYQYHLG